MPWELQFIWGQTPTPRRQALSAESYNIRNSDSWKIKYPTMQVQIKYANWLTYYYLPVSAIEKSDSAILENWNSVFQNDRFVDSSKKLEKNASFHVLGEKMPHFMFLGEKMSHFMFSGESQRRRWRFGHTWVDWSCHWSWSQLWRSRTCCHTSGNFYLLPYLW